jgi:hypothetical protein
MLSLSNLKKEGLVEGLIGGGKNQIDVCSE